MRAPIPAARLLGTWLLLAALASLPAAAADERSITTSGEAQVNVVPDEVLIHLGVTTFKPTLDETRKENDADCARLVSAMKTFGVREADMRTDWLNVSIQYRSDDPGRGIEGYEAQRTYAVTLREISRFEAFVDACLRNGSNWVIDHQFRTSELRKYRDEGRRRALRAAREKAVALAAEVGCRVGAPRSISEGYMGYWGGWGGPWGSGRQMAQNVQFSQGGGRVGEEGETMPLGQIAITASVNATFDLIPESRPPGAR